LIQGSELDKEAARRATTFYLVDRRFDMLPSILSSDLCSLHGKKDRLAVSLIWVLSADLKVVKSTWYGRTVIHNIQAMTYDQAHNILHDQEPDDPSKLPPPLTAGEPVDRSILPQLKEDLAILTHLSRKLRKDREDIGGAVDLSTGDRGSELKFVLDNNGVPTKATPKKEMEIHQTIAELMIMANGFVGKKIYEHYPQSSLLRIHRSVEAERFGELAALLHAGGFKFDGKNNSALAETLRNVRNAKNYNSTVGALFQTLATRAMSEAQYICTGVRNEDDGSLGHYGLGIELYTHFTSPIRRFCDVVVHRLLLATLNNMDKDTAVDDCKSTSILLEATSDVCPSNSNPYSANEVSIICERLNKQNRKAKQSSMECQRLFLSLFFKTNVDIVPAVVLSLRQNGMIVYVPKYDMKGPLYLSDRDGNLQIDPSILGISTESGLPASSGFADVSGYRMFPNGECILHHNSSEVKQESELIVKVPGCKKEVKFKQLDVCSIQISCNISEMVARIPSPRFHLVAEKYLMTTPSKHKQINSADIQQHRNTLHSIKNDESIKAQLPIHDTERKYQSIFQIIDDIEVSPRLDDTPLRLNTIKYPTSTGDNNTCTYKIPGRLLFGGFNNMDTISVAQEANITALRYRNDSSAGNIDGYNNSRRLEREVTTRMQRLAADKRNSKRSQKK